MVIINLSFFSLLLSASLSSINNNNSFFQIDLEWWLSERDVIETDLNENPREYQQTSLSNMEIKSVSKQSKHYYSDEDI